MSRFPDDVLWLVPPIVAGGIVYLVYLATNPYPAHGAGLFFTMAAAVSDHGYALPRTIPYYTPSGVPFAYPPLAIYALALLRDGLGLGPLATSRWLPGPFVIAGLVPAFFLARELLDSRFGASLVATLVAVNPPLLDWHLTAGGLVRAPAFLFATVGLYGGLRRVRSGERRWLGLSVACFLLTLLSHPTTALFLAVSYLVLFAVVDGSPAGLVDGAVVGVGGVVLAAPWWLSVVRTHGPGVFVAAMGTHGGIGGGVATRLGSTPNDPAVLFVVAVVTLSLLAGAVTGRSFLVAWLLAVGLVLGQPRFTLFVWTFLLVAVGHEIGTRLRPWDHSWVPRDGPALVLGVAVLSSSLTGAWYIQDDTAAPRLSVTPNNLDGTDLDAMAWARSNTPADASFVVLGDAAEWFPLFAERTVLVSPWGTEWEGTGSYDRHTSIFRTVSRCSTERCLTIALERHAVRPDYVYVPTDQYPVQGTPHDQTAALSTQLGRSDHYRLVFENEGVAIFRTTPPRSRDPTTGAASRASQTSSERAFVAV